jgi:hypothetical protein
MSISGKTLGKNPPTKRKQFGDFVILDRCMLDTVLLRE